MEWIMKMIYPVIKDCESPEEARKKVIEWGKSQEPRDAACALIMVDFVNEKYSKGEMPEQLNS